MTAHSPFPPAVARLLGVAGQRLHELPGRDALWRCDHPELGPIVVRRNDPRAHPPTQRTLDHDIGWVHRFLTDLARTSFPAPLPVPALDGSSLTIESGAIWEAVTFLPGTVVAWAAAPPMAKIGNFLARFHAASSQVTIDAQRSPAWPIGRLAVEVRAAATTSELSPVERQLLLDASDRLMADLDTLDYRSTEQITIHGDFTNHNVLATGTPPTVSGVIDFANSYNEVALADVAFALWRSGRPHQWAQSFDSGRVADFVAGYHSVRPLTASDAGAIVAYLTARGLQIISKQLDRGRFDPGPLRKLAWLDEHGPELAGHIRSTLARSPE